jgi:hypothetical protein
MSSAEIEAELSDIPDELPRIPTVGNAMGQRGLKGAIDDALTLNRMPQDHADSENKLAVDQGTASALKSCLSWRMSPGVGDAASSGLMDARP